MTSTAHLPVKTLIKPWKGLKRPECHVAVKSIECENPNKTLEGIKTHDNVWSHLFPTRVKTLIKPWKGLKQQIQALDAEWQHLGENPNKTLEGIKTRSFPYSHCLWPFK
ncbi:hypothetical protein U27_01452 [Candidatus Vecturithrix granuli]|uniref:Uncharacterized protein n=1 Tax=Vecturithrix granuli TaxID=1499967 RepID=A0A081CAE6_VECG1|nr:hypothetical protein U27_01452 [Candidatus Vecturithrix granuli]